MKTITQQQMDNLIEARDVMWPNIPKENVIARLSGWRENIYEEVNCGTIACFGGWCAVYPKFMEQGIFANAVGMPQCGIVEYDVYGGVDKFLFGHRGLFSGNYTGRDDHDEVTHRINEAIKNSIVA